MLRSPPTSPSASAHVVPVPVAPAELCASCQVEDSPGHHIARSTTIRTPLVEATVVDTATSASGNPLTPANCSASTRMFDRLLAGAVRVREYVVPSPNRYVTCTC